MSEPLIRAGFLGACPYPVPQGSQVFLRDHARAFAEAGHHACLITYAHGVGEDASGLAIHRGPALPFGNRTRSGPSLAKPLLDLALVATVRRVVREERLDVVFAHNYEALAVALAARACRVVYHAHNTLEDELPHYFGGAQWVARVGRLVDRGLPRRAHAVAVPHARLRDHLITCGCRPGQIAVVPPPVWAEDWPQMRVGEAVPPVLYAGNLDAYQNLPLLLKAMAIVRRSLPGARLHLATSAMPAPQGAEVVADAGFESLRGLLAGDAVFAVPRTAWSGYPVKILNAMAAGMPVVACQGAAHAITHDETGLVVPDNDAEAFAAALLRLLQSPEDRKRLGTAARDQVLTANTPSVAARALLGLSFGSERKTRRF